MYLSQKKAVITGISKGIGKALAQQLLAAGVGVTGWGLTPPGYQHPLLRFIPCDVSDEEAVSNAARLTLEEGPVDFLINNAGLGYFSPIATFDMEKWKRMFEVNVTGTFLVSRALAPQMQARKSGHIINISSIAGKVGMPQGEGYNATKWAVTGLTDCLFQDLRQDGVKVTTVFPGSTRTEFFNEIPGAAAHANMVDPEELAGTLVHILNTSPNYLVREIEVRPLNSKPPR